MADIFDLLFLNSTVVAANAAPLLNTTNHTLGTLSHNVTNSTGVAPVIIPKHASNLTSLNVTAPPIKHLSSAKPVKIVKKVQSSDTVIK